MENEKEELPPFRWNKQAVFMACFFAAMLALPLLGVAFFGNYTAPARPAKSPAAEVKVDTDSLQQGLEKMSETRFSSSVTLENADVVRLEVAKDDMDARIARIGEIAKEAGGGALEMSEAGTSTRRVMANVPRARAELLRRAIRGDRVDFTAIPAGTATEMVQIELGAP